LDKIKKIVFGTCIVFIAMMITGVYSLLIASKSGQDAALAIMTTPNGGVVEFSNSELTLIWSLVAHQTMLLGVSLLALGGLGIILCLHWVLEIQKHKED
jgi:hypothetical protein